MEHSSVTSVGRIVRSNRIRLLGTENQARNELRDPEKWSAADLFAVSSGQQDVPVLTHFCSSQGVSKQQYLLVLTILPATGAYIKIIALH